MDDQASIGALPIIPWIGGKRRLAKKLLPMFPEHTCYVEPFAGAAALLFIKRPAKAEVLNDINGDLVNLYRVVKHHLEEFVRQFKWALASREIFRWLQATPPETLTDVQRAARFYYLQQLCFGARIEGRTFGTATTSGHGLNLLRLEEELSAAHLRLSRVTIERLAWQECVERYDREHTLFYMDPPYWGTEGYGVPFELEQYEQLAAAMRKIQGMALLSVNDVPEMRRVSAGLRTIRVSLADVLNNSRSAKRRAGKARRELVIRSW